MHRRFFPALWFFMHMAFVMPVSMQAQIWDCDTSLAVERWSEPVRLPDNINVPGWTKYYPSFAPDGKTLYFYSGALSRTAQTTLTDTGWTEPVLMEAVKDYDLVRGTFMSSDYNTFYFCSYAGNSWYIFTTTWEKDSARWAPPESLLMWTDTIRGSQGQAFALMPVAAQTVYVTPDKRELYFSGGARDDCSGFNEGSGVYVSTWDEEHNRWGQPCFIGWDINWRVVCPDLSSFDTDAPSLTANGNKMYMHKELQRPYNFELYVSVKDSLGEWGRAKRLNINSYADTSDKFVNGIWNGTTTGFDYMPAIAPDGRMLVFAGRRNTMLNGRAEELYLSHLLVDECGDSVVTGLPESVVDEIPSLQMIVSPNPFNDNITVNIQLDKPVQIQVLIYDMYGRLLRNYSREREHNKSIRINWDGSANAGCKVPAGVYFVVAVIPGQTITKMIIRY